MLLIEALLFDFQHPGGEEIILENAGEDCSEAFEDASHSNDAKEMLKDFFIGHLAQVSLYSGDRIIGCLIKENIQLQWGLEY